MTLFKSTGILRYTKSENGYKLVLEIDRGIQLFYRSLIPKWHPTNTVRAVPHITLFRRGVPKNLSAWGAYEGRRVEFFYDTDIEHDDTYWWLNCYSVELEKIAYDLGMLFGNYRGKKALDGFKKIWHTTIANTKGVK